MKITLIRSAGEGKCCQAPMPYPCEEGNQAGPAVTLRKGTLHDSADTDLLPACSRGTS